MKIFISYSTTDTELVAALHGDLERMGHEVWRDVELIGGQEWWKVICEQIRTSDVFVFSLSARAVRSRYCRAELVFAHEAGCHLLPINLTDVGTEDLPAELRDTEWVDYRERSSEAAIALGRALATLDSLPPVARQTIELPESPIADVEELRLRVEAPTLTFDEQRQLLHTVADQFDGLEDVLGDVVRAFRRRPDVVEQVAAELDTLLEHVQDRSVSGVAGRMLAKGLLTFIENGQFTPIVGTGLTDSLVGSRRTLAREFAGTFEFPMSSHQREDLAQVAQFVNVMAGEETLRATLSRHLVNRLRTSAGETAGSGPPAPGEIDTLLAQVWDTRPTTRPDPHQVLASLPCPLYISAHPGQLLEHALRCAGKDPVSDICRWRRDVDDWPDSPLDQNGPDPYVPSAERPLVYHVFGRLDVPTSLVLTEDDYFEFLIGVSEDRSIIPPMVKRALADSALLIIGFRLDDWDSRTMLRALVRQEGSFRRSRYKHVAAQVDLTGSVVSPNDARQYLDDYFGKVNRPPIDVFWGSVDELITLLQTLWEQRG